MFSLTLRFWRCLLWFCCFDQFLTAFITKGIFGWVFRVAIRAYQRKLRPAFTAKFGSLSVIKLAFWALHLTPPGEIEEKDYLWTGMEFALSRKEINKKYADLSV
jgi:hypothetical protein